jgi:uncharacterized protein YkwD
MVPVAARHPLIRFAALLCAATGLLGLAAPSSTAQRSVPTAPAAQATLLVAGAPSPDVESAFVSRINSLRASKGLSQLAVSGELVGVARNWTERMVQAGQISHNPNLGSQVGGDWTKLGENVGVGYDVDGLMQAFINSPAHYANLVDPEWTHVGVGVVMAADGRMYTTHNFMALGSAPAPEPEPEPAPVTPRPSSGGSGSGSGSGSTAASSPEEPGGGAVAEEPVAPPAPARPEPTPQRVTAVLDPLRSLES